MQFLWAFLIGGALCIPAQFLIELTKLTPARILVIYVVSGTVLGILGAYQPLVEFAGCGASVPLTGFGNVLAQGVKEAVAKEGIIGAFTGGLTASSAGISVTLVAAILSALAFKSRAK